MFLYTVLAALSAIVAGILIAVCIKKSKDEPYPNMYFDFPIISPK